MNRRLIVVGAVVGRLGDPLDQAARQRRQRQRSVPAPGERDTEQRIAEGAREDVRHLVAQPRRREALAVHEDLARPGPREQRVAGADQRLLRLGARELPDGDRQRRLDAQQPVQLVVAELEILDQQGQLDRRVAFLGIVAQHEVRRAPLARQRARADRRAGRETRVAPLAAKSAALRREQHRRHRQRAGGASAAGRRPRPAAAAANVTAVAIQTRFASR